MASWKVLEPPSEPRFLTCRCGWRDWHHHVLWLGQVRLRVHMLLEHQGEKGFLVLAVPVILSGTLRDDPDFMF